MLRRLSYAILVAAYALLSNPASPNFASFQAANNGAAFTGFLDTYSGNGATWGFSAYKLTNAYAGNWGTVQRQSDNATQVIGFLANGKADTSTFNTFCSGTNCYARILVDQVSSINPTQTTLANMPRAYVNANGNLAVCGTPTSVMTTSFSSTVNTAKQHLFTVAKAGYADARRAQADLPRVAVTGNVTVSSTAVTAMSSQVGISTVNGDGGFFTKPGVTDSAAFLPNAPSTGATGATTLSALPTGTTATLAYDGNANSTGSQTGDTLTFTNAVTQGAWIYNGPNSTYYSSAYWGFGMGANGFGSGSFTMPINGGRAFNFSNFQNVVGEGMRGAWGVYDNDTFTAQLNYNSVSLGIFGDTPSTANITYSTNVGMTLLEGASNNCFETMVLFPATQASRAAMAQFLMTQDTISFPFAPATSDGFTMTGVYQPNNPQQGSPSVYGQRTYGPDVFGITWDIQTGGYTWPALAFANNINNSATLWRFIVQQGDSDQAINFEERSEINIDSSNTVPGNSFSFFYQFQFDALPTQTGSWCYFGQIHYVGNISAAPDIVGLQCLNGQIQIVTQKGAGPTTTNCGSAQTLTVGTTYAIVGTGFWSTNHTSDTLTINLGANGGSLTQVCNTSGSLWDNDGGAYVKHGIYRGGHWQNPGTAILRVMNAQWAPSTANAYSSFITSQPALPTHP